MTLIELKNIVNTISDEFNHFDVFDGKIKQVEENEFYRTDEPVTMIIVDKENKGIIFLTEDVVG